MAHCNVTWKMQCLQYCSTISGSSSMFVSVTRFTSNESFSTRHRDVIDGRISWKPNENRRESVQNIHLSFASQLICQFQLNNLIKILKRMILYKWSTTLASWLIHRKNQYEWLSESNRTRLAPGPVTTQSRSVPNECLERNEGLQDIDTHTNNLWSSDLLLNQLLNTMDWFESILDINGWLFARLDHMNMSDHDSDDTAVGGWRFDTNSIMKTTTSKVRLTQKLAIDRMRCRSVDGVVEQMSCLGPLRITAWNSGSREETANRSTER